MKQLVFAYLLIFIGLDFVTNIFPYPEKLFAPWRKTYTINKEGCPFCTQLQQSDDSKNLILRRFPHTVVILNLYPYTTGHLLIVSTQHIGDIENLSRQARSELIEVISQSTVILKNILNVQDFNVGYNIGRVAGASVPDHLHVHIIPRHICDIGTINLIGNAVVIPYNTLEEVYNKLLPAFANIDITY